MRINVRRSGVFSQREIVGWLASPIGSPGALPSAIMKAGSCLRASRSSASSYPAAMASKISTVRAFTRRKPVRKPFPDHLSRERVVVEAPTSCTCCGSDRILKMGEDITVTLEVIPRQWKVIQTVREKFTCRACEKISQPPAPFHAIPRGWAGPSLIAMIAFDKYGQHQPLNRQAERIAREGVDLSLSTLADLIGHACVALAPFMC